LTFLCILFINYAVFIFETGMVLDKDNNLNTTSLKSNEEQKNKFDLEDIFSEHDNSEIIEKEYETLINTIENIIKSTFLKKEFYENLPDWSNPEIDNVCNHSASDIENRINEGKWVLFMNPCISQTLYLIDKLKKRFPHISKNMNLCIETLRLSKLNIRSVHTFIQINMPNKEPLIIDYAHDNDVYIYQWKYTNRSSQAIKTETIGDIPNIRKVPVNSFGENDTIFDIAKRSNVIEEWDLEILSSRIQQLKTHNTKSRFEHWQEKNKEVRIFNLLLS